MKVKSARKARIGSRELRLAAMPLAALLYVTNAPSHAQDARATVAGVVTLPEPTVEHVSVEWAIEGDSNNNGVVSMRFRAEGETAWRQGMPLRRIPAGSNEGRSWRNRHSGSLFGLRPNTAYTIELTLADPEGGSATRQVSVRTRGVPTPGTGAVRAATPATLATVLGQAMPGDIVELAAGNYAGFTINRDGAAGRPLTLRGLPGAVINGEIGLFTRRHVILKSLTVNGRIRFNGSDDIAVLDCVVNASSTYAGDGIVAYTRAARSYIAGNTINGLTIWRASAFGVSGDNRGEGIAVTGPGHVVTRNRLRGFRDGISFMEDGGAVDQYSLDVLGNEISDSADDGIEADFCEHNCRIIGNHLTNSFIAFSAQPSLGGPTYFIRNQAYNVAHVPFKLYRGSIGDVVLHNTIVKHGDGLNAYSGRPISRALFRNNLFLGGPGGTFNGYTSGSGRVVDAATVDMSNSSLDYNGYGTTLSDFNGRIGAVSFSGVSELTSKTSEKHGIRVGYSVFANAVAFPADPTHRYAPVWLGLAAGSAAIDRGERIPNINDGFGGNGPDLGAVELASPGGGQSGGSMPFRSGFEDAAP